MRRLRAISQTPGELQWRMELLATLERMRLSHEVGIRAMLQNQRAMQKILSSLTPVELAKSINREIDQREKNRDSAKYRGGWKSLRSHTLTALIAIFVTIVSGIVIWKVTGK